MMLNYLQGWMDHLQVHMHMNPHLLVKDSNLQKPRIQQYLSNILLQWNLLLPLKDLVVRRLRRRSALLQTRWQALLACRQALQ